MRVVRYSILDSLVPLANDWDRLSRGVPFRSWHWLSTWWRSYGLLAGNRQQLSLYVLAVFDGSSRLVGVAPWYLESTAAQGVVARFLGSGEVCSDYLSILCEPGLEAEVAESLAEWLLENGRGGRSSLTSDGNGWDLLHCYGVDAEDPAVGALVDKLAERDYTVHRRPGPNCWRIELPERWEDYLGMLAKNYRHKLRDMDRTLVASGRAELFTVYQRDQLDEAQRILIDLHQARRRQLGDAGCFRCETFATFHREVMPRLLSAGQLQLHWAELDGRPIAAEYQIAGSGVVYAYQSGIDPERLRSCPGHLLQMMTIRRAIEQGYRGYDFLRGDEPYKARWRARPHASLDVRIVPSRVSARLRHGLWLAGTNLKQLVKSGLRLGSPPAVAKAPTKGRRCPRALASAPARSSNPDTGSQCSP